MRLLWLTIALGALTPASVLFAWAVSGDCDRRGGDCDPLALALLTALGVLLLLIALLAVREAVRAARRRAGRGRSDG